MISEKDLSRLNEEVYYTDPKYGKYVIVGKQGSHLGKNEKNSIVIGNKQFQVLSVKNDTSTGFQGMAVAPIVKGKPDYQQVAVVAAGTNPSDWKDLVGAGLAAGTDSSQVQVALDYVKELKAHKDWQITQLTGYSQSSYMLKVGARYHIPTTVFNGWFQYDTLSESDKAYMKGHSELFVNYRHTKDNVTWWNDFNTMLLNGEDYGTVVWVEGDSHDIQSWQFDRHGKLIVKGSETEQENVKLTQIENRTAAFMWQLSELKHHLQKSGGQYTANEKIFIDSSQALLMLENGDRAVKVGIKAAIKEYQKAIEEAEELWEQAIQIAQNIGTALGYGEVQDALERGSVTYESIVSAKRAHNEQKMAQTQKIAANHEQLVAEIKESIAKLIKTDQQLAQALQR